MTTAKRPVLQYASDLHLEFYANVPRDGGFFRKLVIPAPNADILILAGDIGHAEAHITEKFIEWCCSNWKYVLWVYGNHEYYTKKPSEKWRYAKPLTIAEKEEYGSKYESLFQNLHILNKKTVQFAEFPDYIFIGATVWTHIPKDQHKNIGYTFSDFKYICKSHTIEEGYIPFRSEDWATLHTEHVEFIIDQLTNLAKNKSPKKCVIITHHLPSYDMILDYYKFDEMNYAFATDLEYILQNPYIVAWFCGHSHGSKEIAKGPCYLNARGYPNESSQVSYNPSKCVDLGKTKEPFTRIAEANQEENVEFI